MAEVQLFQQREVADLVRQRRETVLGQVQGAQRRRQVVKFPRELVQLALRQLQGGGLLRGFVVPLQRGVTHVASVSPRGR